MVWFHRGIRKVTGGSIKHSHYFEHVLRIPGFEPKIAMFGEPASEAYARTVRRLWPERGGRVVPRWEPGPRDLFFLAGVDWRFPARCGLMERTNPRINLIQGVRHACEGTELYGYLSERAIRICVSQEVTDAIRATGQTRGPVLTIPNGIDVTPVGSAAGGSPAGFETRRTAVTIVGYKRRELAEALSARLESARIEHRLLTQFVDRDSFIELLAGSRVAVCLPYAREGFYLPALEAMAVGALVVTLDCVGNRGFCRHGGNCLVAEPDPDSLLRAATDALAMPAAERERMHRSARETVAGHSMEAERRRFHDILRDIDHLWRMA